MDSISLNSVPLWCPHSSPTTTSRLTDARRTRCPGSRLGPAGLLPVPEALTVHPSRLPPEHFQPPRARPPPTAVALRLPAPVNHERAVSTDLSVLVVRIARSLLCLASSTWHVAAVYPWCGMYPYHAFLRLSSIPLPRFPTLYSSTCRTIIWATSTF